MAQDVLFGYQQKAAHHGSGLDWEERSLFKQQL